MQHKKLTARNLGLAVDFDLSFNKSFRCDHVLLLVVTSESKEIEMSLWIRRFRGGMAPFIPGVLGRQDTRMERQNGKSCSSYGRHRAERANWPIDKIDTSMASPAPPPTPYFVQLDSTSCFPTSSSIPIKW